MAFGRLMFCVSAAVEGFSVKYFLAVLGYWQAKIYLCTPILEGSGQNRKKQSFFEKEAHIDYQKDTPMEALRWFNRNVL
jgi:hypothetical protein